MIGKPCLKLRHKALIGGETVALGQAVAEGRDGDRLGQRGRCKNCCDREVAKQR